MHVTLLVEHAQFIQVDVQVVRLILDHSLRLIALLRVLLEHMLPMQFVNSVISLVLHVLVNPESVLLVQLISSYLTMPA